MAQARTGGYGLQTRWSVQFGPRRHMDHGRQHPASEFLRACFVLRREACPRQGEQSISSGAERGHPIEAGLMAARIGIQEAGTGPKRVTLGEGFPRHQVTGILDCIRLAGNRLVQHAVT